MCSNLRTVWKAPSRKIVWEPLKKSTCEVKAPIARSHCQSRPSRGLYRMVFLLWSFTLARQPDCVARREKVPACFPAVRRECVATPKRAIGRERVLRSPDLKVRNRRDVEMRETLKTRRPNTQGKKNKKKKKKKVRRHAACPRARAFTLNVKIQANRSGEQWQSERLLCKHPWSFDRHYRDRCK